MFLFLKRVVLVFLFLGITLSVQEKNSKIKREIAEVELEIEKNGRYLSNDYYRKRKEELSGYVSVSVSLIEILCLKAFCFSSNSIT